MSGDRSETEGAPFHVVVVEDDHEQRSLVARWLIPRADLVIVMTSNVAGARHVLERCSVDLVITDIDLPDETGFALARRAVQLHPHVSVLVITALTGAEIILEALRSGVHDFLHKPLGRDALLSTVDALLVRARTRKSEQGAPLSEGHAGPPAESRSHRRAVQAERARWAGIMHNFNNTLSTILPIIELCEARASTDLRPLLADAIRASRDAADLIRQSLRTARSGALESHAVDVAAMVQEVVRLCRRAFDPSIRIGLHLRSEGAHVLAAEGELNHLLLNLLINARDALVGRQDREIIVDVESRGGYVFLRVVDSGVGMSEGTLRRVGSPFFSTKAPGQGTGLGLSTVYATVRKLGGTIQCESQLGRGTSFEIRLAQSRSEAVELREPVSNTTSGAPRTDVPRSSLAGARVLIVDDDARVGRSLARQLESAGLEPVLRLEAEPALRALGEEGPFQAVLLDMSLPPVNGQSVLQNIRRAWRALPVVLLSGSIPTEDQQGDAQGTLLKPVRQAELLEALEAAINPDRDASGALRVLPASFAQVDPAQ